MSEPPAGQPLTLLYALGIARGQLVSIIGAGGKTSLLWALTEVARAAGLETLATTTTRMAAAERDLFPAWYAVRENDGPAAFRDRLSTHRSALLYSHIDGEKLYGLAPAHILEVADEIAVDLVLAEADGARQARVKLPYAHEPVIMPSRAGFRPSVVVVGGWGAVGRPIAEAYNAGALCALLGEPPNAPLTADGFLRVLAAYAREAARRAPGALVSLFINTAELAEGADDDPSPAELRAADVPFPIVVGEVRAPFVIPGGRAHVRRRIAPTAVIILAAGLSSRMGRPKALLPWHGGRPLLAHIIDEAAEVCAPDMCFIVLGHHSAEVLAAMDGAGLATPPTWVFNPDYAAGEMLSSLQAGLRALPPHVGAVMVVLGDAPFFSAALARRVRDRWETSGAAVAAPSFERRRGHPILFGRAVIDAVLTLPPGAAPRDAINRFAGQTAYVELDGLSDGDTILIDVDTPDAYQAARVRAGLPPISV